MKSVKNLKKFLSFFFIISCYILSSLYVTSQTLGMAQFARLARHVTKRFVWLFLPRWYVTSQNPLYGSVRPSGTSHHKTLGMDLFARLVRHVTKCLIWLGSPAWYVTSQNAWYGLVRPAGTSHHETLDMARFAQLARHVTKCLVWLCLPGYYTITT